MRGKYGRRRYFFPLVMEIFIVAYSVWEYEVSFIYGVLQNMVKESCGNTQ